MREPHLKMSVWIDGFVAGRHGESDWIFATNGDDADAWTMASVSNASLHIMGTKTFSRHDVVVAVCRLQRKCHLVEPS